jgi:hypothetical protein
MHIVLGALGTIITILILVNRLSNSGVDVGWLNPFAWKRRREWANKYHVNPIYSLKNPMDITALLVLALAKSEGDISADQKKEILNIFGEVFHLDSEESTSLFTASNFLLKDGLSPIDNMRKLLAPSSESFTQEQVNSSSDLFTHIANYEGPANSFQQEVISSFDDYFATSSK